MTKFLTILAAGSALALVSSCGPDHGGGPLARRRRRGGRDRRHRGRGNHRGRCVVAVLAGLPYGPGYAYDPGYAYPPAYAYDGPAYYGSDNGYGYRGYGYRGWARERRATTPTRIATSSARAERPRSSQSIEPRREDPAGFFHSR